MVDIVAALRTLLIELHLRPTPQIYNLSLTSVSQQL